MESWTTIEGGTLGIADGDETPEPLSGVLVITPRFASLSTETGFIVTGPIYVPVKDGVIPEIHVPAVEDGTALVEFRLKGQLCGPVEFPDTEIPVEPGTTIRLSDYIPRGVDPGTGGILVPGPPGPPGAVASPEDYSLIGPGRPDVPASTGGLVSASTPVGATYTSTDGAGVGAWQWLNTGDGWSVTVGDTGWRSLPPLIEGTATVIIRRTTTAGVMASAMTSAQGNRVILATIPDGFRVAKELGTWNAFVTAGRFGNENGSISGDIYYLMPEHGIAINSPNAALNKGGLTWTPTDPWPTTLPGTPID